jgi:ATP synthase protein I
MDDERSEPTSKQPEDKPDNFWRLVAQASQLGWNMVIPIVGGVLLGRYLDDMFGKEFTWTLTLLLMGVAVAFNNLYTIYIEHSDAEPLGKRIEKRRQKKIQRDENHAKNE